MTEICMPISGLLLLITSFVIWLRHKKLFALKERLFLHINLSLIESFVFEILFLKAMFYPSGISEHAQTILLQYYIGCFIFTVPLIILYLTVDITKINTFKAFEELFITIAVLCFLLVVSFPVKAEVINGVCVITGSARTVVFVIGWALVLVTALILNHYKAKIERWQRLSLIIWFVAFTCGTVIEYFYNIHIINFMSTLGIFSSALVSENPKYNYGAVENTFGYPLFKKIFAERISDKINFPILYINLTMVAESYGEKGKTKTDEVISQICEFAYKEKGKAVFSSNHNELIIIGEEDSDLQTLSSDITEYINGLEDKDRLRTTLKLLRISNARLFGAVGEFEEAVRHCKVQNLVSQKFAFTEQFGLKESNNAVKERKVLNTITDVIKEKNIRIEFLPIYAAEKGGSNSYFDVSYYVNDAAGKRINPDIFIPILRKNNKTEEFERCMFEILCSEINEMKAENANVGFSVPLISSVGSEFYKSELRVLFEKAGTDPKSVCLELPNTEIFEDREGVIDVLNGLKEAGFILAVRGFGKGESNLNYLTDLPIDAVKFDPDLLHRATSDKKAEFILSNIVRLAQKIGIKVGIIGVENKEQEALALSLKPEFMQGKYLIKEGNI